MFGSRSGRRAHRVHGSSLGGQPRIQLWKLIRGLTAEVPFERRARDRPQSGRRSVRRRLSSGGIHAHVASEHQAELCVCPYE